LHHYFIDNWFWRTNYVFAIYIDVYFYKPRANKRFTGGKQKEEEPVKSDIKDEQDRPGNRFVSKR
jgi:hypothetical protein